MLGFITGSGFYDLPGLRDEATVTVPTPYGDIGVTTGRWHDAPVAFLSRHGADHSVPPQQINYRGNLWALKDLGVTEVLATAVSGGINEAYGTGDLVLIDDFIDWTTGRADTFFDQPGKVVHTEMDNAYDPELRARMARAAAAANIEIHYRGTYICFNGPRFETPAEIRMVKTLGADLVGMTGYPEQALARELGLAYASVGLISNPAAGQTSEEISLEQINAAINAGRDVVLELFKATIAQGRIDAEEADGADGTDANG